MMRNDDPNARGRQADDFALARTTSPGNPSPTPYEVTEPGDVRVEIEQTRAEMSGTLEAIQEKLNPTQLKDQAKDVVQDAAEQAKQLVQEAAKTAADQAREVVHEAVHDAAEQAKEVVRVATQDAKDAVHDATVGRAEEAVSEATERVRGVGSTMLETIKQNPIPAALAGIGLGWLFMKRGDNESSPDRSRSTSGSARRFTDTSPTMGREYREQWSGYRGTGSNNEVSGEGVAEQAKDRISGAVDQVQEKAGRMTDQVQDKAGRVADDVQDRTARVTDRFQRMREESPLALGGLALAAGATIGLLLPTTEHEDELVGQTRDRVMQKAQETVKEVQPKVERLVDDVKSATQAQT